MGSIAFTHPGKLGDAIYSLPVMRYICDTNGITCDFYTSEYCRPLVRLFEYQPFIDRVIIPSEYKIIHMNMGCQPYIIPTEPGYETVYHLGFSSWPVGPIPEFIANSIGFDIPIEIKYDYPEAPTLNEDYIILAPREPNRMDHARLFQDLIATCPIKVVIVGGSGDNTFSGSNIIDITGMDILETTNWIAKSRGFVGFMSAMLVIANGFDIKKIGIPDAYSGDMGHTISSDTNFYPVNPTSAEVLSLLS